MNRLYLFFVFAFLTPAVLAQQTKIDSLKILSQSENLFTKAKNKLLLIGELSKESPLETQKQYDSFLQIDLSQLCDSNFRKITLEHVDYLHSVFEIQKSISVLKEGLIIGKERRDSIAIGAFHQGLSDSYFFLVKHDSCSYHLDKAEQIYTKLNMLQEVGRITTAKSRIAYEQGDYENALRHSFKASNIFKQAKDKNQLSIAYAQLGNIFFFLENYIEAEEYYKLSSKEFKEQGNLFAFHLCNSNLGLVLSKQNKERESISILLKSIQYFEQNRKTYQLSNAYGFIASSYFKYNDLDSAEFYNDKASRIAYKTNNLTAMAEGLELEAEIAQSRGSLIEAEIKAKKSFQIFDSLNIYQATQESAKILSSIYEELNLIDSSFKYLKINIKHKESASLNSAHFKKYAILHHAQIEESNYKLQLASEQEKMRHQLYEEQQSQKLSTAILIAGASFFLLIIAIIFLIRNKKLNREIESNQEYIKEQLVIKESLLSEIHHRVKNNLQVISSMLSLQAQHITDEALQKTINDCKGRISSMSLIHESLYQKIDQTEALFSVYIQNLIPMLIRTYHIDESKIKLNMELDDIQLSLETSIPCGLIINEIISNSLKHAFLDDTDGEITIRLKKINDMVELTVADNGPGLKDDVNFENQASFGFLLIDTLTKQLEAKLELDSQNKMEYKLSFISESIYA